MIHAQIFYTILKISIKASILIGVILLIKSIWGEKMGAKNQYCLWFLLIIKLLLPPHINLSFFNMLSQISPYYILIKPPYFPTEADIISWFTKDFTVSQELMQQSGASFFSLPYILPSIWILGVIALMMYMIIVNIKFRHLINNSKITVGKDIKQILLEHSQRLNVNKQLKVYKSPFIHSPCLYGFFKPCILLPQNIEEKINTEELKYVISHELAHFKRKDIFIYLLISILQIIYWFNPIILYGLYRMKNDCEIACDALALSSFEKDEKQNYGLSIIHLLEKSKTQGNHIITTEFVNSKKYLKRRIIMIKEFKKGSYRLSFITILGFVLIASFFLTNGNVQATPNQNLVGQSISQGEMIWPVPSFTKISSSFGTRINPITKEERTHTGIDIPAEKGESIVAAANGKVILADLNEGYGKTVIIDHGNSIATLYGHCSELLVNENDMVSSGTEIAKVGQTGLATGNHLHFEVRKDGEAVNPLEYIKKEEL